VAENESVPGLTPSVFEAAATVNVTGTWTVWPFPVTLIVPVNVPADNPLTTGDTARLAGVVPLEGDTFNHDPPLTLAVYAVLGLADNDSLWDEGDAPPAVAEKESDVGLTVNVLAAAMVNDTGMLTRCSSPYWIWIVPLYVPAARPEGLAEIVNVCGVVRDPEGKTDSQVWPPLVPEAATLM
jgi:hypothetical protein